MKTILSSLSSLFTKIFKGCGQTSIFGHTVCYKFMQQKKNQQLALSNYISKNCLLKLKYEQTDTQITYFRAFIAPI